MESSILLDGSESGARAATLLPGLLGKARPTYDALRIDVLDPTCGTYTHLLDGLRESGWHVTSQHQSRTWINYFSNQTYDQYVRTLPSGIRRLDRKFAENPDLTFVLVTREEDLDGAFRAYDRVYSMSWKEPETYPAFMPAFLRSLARVGGLRLGLLYHLGQPVAAQVWVVSGKHATIYKIAYDERFKKLGVGSMLLLRMFRHVVGEDGVTEVSFGMGDDAYKQTWMSEARDIRRLVAYNTHTIRGACASASTAAKDRVRSLGMPFGWKTRPETPGLHGHRRAADTRGSTGDA